MKVGIDRDSSYYVVFLTIIFVLVTATAVLLSIVNKSYMFMVVVAVMDIPLITGFIYSLYMYICYRLTLAKGESRKARIEDMGIYKKNFDIYIKTEDKKKSLARFHISESDFKRLKVGKEVNIRVYKKYFVLDTDIITKKVK